jgi:hypothetical protein
MAAGASGAGDHAIDMRNDGDGTNRGCEKGETEVRTPSVGSSRKPVPRRIYRALLTAALTVLVFLLLPTVLMHLFHIVRRYIFFIPSLLMARRTPPKINLIEWAHADPARACVLELEAAHARNDVSPSQLRCCIRKIRRHMPLALSKRDKSVLLSLGFSSRFLGSLPDHQLPRFKTCAVVSNAPSLRLRDFGTNLSQEIDAASAVFRLNIAPVEGFERYVGSKEKFRLINLHSGVSADANVVRSFDKKSIVFIRDENYMRSSTTNVSNAWNVLRYHEMGALDEYMYLREVHPDSPIFLNHPVFAEFALSYLHTNILEPARTKSLSTGTEAVLLAMMLCDKVTSYEVCSNDAASLTHRYYYDMVGSRGYRWYHPKNVEGALLKLLSTHQRPGTSIYEYDMTSDADRCPSEDAAVPRRARLRDAAVPS